jgi:phosphoserine phosphatase
MIPNYRDLFDDVFLNQLQFDQHGRLSGVVHTDFDFEGKVRALEQICQSVGCTMQESVFVGEGFNDKDVIRKAGFSIAYPPTAPESEVFSNAVIREDDLSLILEHILLL